MRSPKSTTPFEFRSVVDAVFVIIIDGVAVMLTTVLSSVVFPSESSPLSLTSLTTADVSELTPETITLLITLPLSTVC